eukprot:1197183-Alexandrium_andersonii.AAC.1
MPRPSPAARGGPQRRNSQPPLISQRTQMCTARHSTPVTLSRNPGAQYLALLLTQHHKCQSGSQSEQRP